jgi:OmpA-OmpF porin, OOP family
MRLNNRNFLLLAIALILSFGTATLGQEAQTPEPATPNMSTNTRTVTDEQKLKIRGVVIASSADSFTLREADGTETVVNLAATTKIKAAKKNWFRRSKVANGSSILRGLQLEVEGRGNAVGQLVAAKIRFTEQDFKTAQSLEARVDPVENLASSTKVLADSNQQRITAAEQNAERLSGQVTELSAVAAAANEAAKGAQVSADRAQAAADGASERINAIDDYDVLETFTVHFRSGSAELSPEAKAEIDVAATKVQNGLKGWAMEIVGYADSKGNTTRNHSLSQRRADAVINYLVTTYNLPLRRLVQPFGYGSLNPVADNATRDGRALNRRVEIKVLVSKGLSSQSSL